MEYLYDNCFPISTLYIQEKMGIIFKNITSSQLEWIADNREYGEKERYRKKADFENTLKGADVISGERKKIEGLFNNNDLETAVTLYQNLLYERIRELNLQYESIFTIPYNLTSLKKYWIELEKISDLDNAHAMYLSSNNWGFSVFNGIIDEILTLLDNDYSKLNSILCAGVEDVRSTLFATFDNSWSNITKDNFYKRIILNHDYVRQNGICPCFAYVSINAPRLMKVFNKEKYVNNILELRDKMDTNKRTLFDRFYKLYCALYYLRIAYDSYEYFGYYSFVRHYAIYMTYNLLLEKGEENANDFKRFASTYQFTHIKNIL
jgi:hypothetical protein